MLVGAVVTNDTVNMYVSSCPSSACCSISCMGVNPQPPQGYCTACITACASKPFKQPSSQLAKTHSHVTNALAVSQTTMAVPDCLTPSTPAGWQHHPVCNSKYHFIIPSEATLEDTRQLTAVVEGIYLKRLPLSFKWAAPAPEEHDDEEAGPYNAAASVFESQDHLLHGVLHLNGYGHLLRMNGSQGGSRRLIGRGSCVQQQVTQ